VRLKQVDDRWRDGWRVVSVDPGVEHQHRSDSHQNAVG
jgi:hypothetical protein